MFSPMTGTRGRTIFPAPSRALAAMYHYVRPPAKDLPFFHAMTPERFESQLDRLGREWDIISLETYLAAVWNRTPLSKPSCILTFDDGVWDHYEVVFPILRRRGLSGAFFVSTAPLVEPQVLVVHRIQHLVGRIPSNDLEERLVRTVRHVAPKAADRLLATNPAQVDSIYSYEPNPSTRRVKFVLNFALEGSIQEEVTRTLFEAEFGPGPAFARRFYLNIDQVRCMAAEGMTVGSHGHRHLAMSACDRLKKQEELRTSKRLLEGWTARPVDTFCFPWGGVHHIDDSSEDILVQEGFRGAMTTVVGINEGTLNPYYLKRRDCIHLEEA